MWQIYDIYERPKFNAFFLDNLAKIHDAYAIMSRARGI